MIDLRLFQNRTFALAFCMMLLVGFALYGSSFALPQILQELMGYTAGAAGEALSTGGIATVVMMPVVGILIGEVDPRKLIVFGYLLMGFSLFYAAQIYLGVSFSWVAKARFYQSLGLSFLFIPVSTLAYVGTRPETEQ